MLPKYQMIADDLLHKIQNGQYDGKRPLPTELAIAGQYRVSRQTVRQALDVLVKAGIVEKRQGSGSYIRQRSRSADNPQLRHVAVVTTYISDYIFPGILREVETILSKKRCAPSLFATHNQVANEREVLKKLLIQDFDGILVEGSKSALPNPNLDLYRLLLERATPLVFMNGNYPGLEGAVSVLDDNYEGGRQLIKYLTGKGHTRIAGLFKSDDIQGHERYAGYTAGLLEAGLPLVDKWIHWYNTENKSYFLLEGTAMFSILIESLHACSAVVCYNDEVANSLISVLTKSGRRIPEDIAVVSFDNSRYSELSSVPITSLAHKDKNVGRAAAEKLIQMMDGEPCDSELIPWTLVERASG